MKNLLFIMTLALSWLQTFCSDDNIKRIESTYPEWKQASNNGRKTLEASLVQTILSSSKESTLIKVGQKMVSSMEQCSSPTDLHAFTISICSKVTGLIFQREERYDEEFIIAMTRTINTFKTTNPKLPSSIINRAQDNVKGSTSIPEEPIIMHYTLRGEEHTKFLPALKKWN